MILIITKAVIAGILISFSSWLANQKPILAGFIVALPLTTLLALILNYWEFQDLQKSITFAKSVLVAVPLSLVFFLPFLFANQLKLPFWQLMGLGLGALVIAFFVHRMIFTGSP